jgi:hypothetical protein
MPLMPPTRRCSTPKTSCARIRASRAEAEADLAQAQIDLDALPAQQRQVLAQLDADHQAAQILALARARSAQGQVDEAV